MKKVKNLISVLLSCAMIFGTGFTTIGQYAEIYGISVSAADVSSYGYFQYTVNSDDTITITKFTNKASDSEAVIPAKIYGKSVTAIGENAFDGCSTMLSVIIPEGVTTIGDYAFNECSMLKYVEMPESLISIGKYAFMRCRRLSSIMIPEKVTSIGSYAFCESSLGSLRSLTIPNSVTSIGENAFSGSNLKSVVLGRGLKKISYQLFSCCMQLKNATIPDTVTEIDAYAFDRCYKLESIAVPKSVTKIGTGAFIYCGILDSIAIYNSGTLIGENAFERCNDLTIYGRSGSIAEGYAESENIPFEELTEYCKGTEPTCTEDGEKEYYYSNFDGGYYEDYDCDKPIENIYSWRIIPAKGHSYKEKVTEPTCTEGGYTTYTCSVCGDSYTDDYTDVIPHSYVKEVTEPTCTEGGYTTYTCSVCGDSYVDDYTDVIPHSYVKEVTEPTCTEGGYTTYTCSVCGDSYKDTYTNATGHKYEETIVAPTTTEQGYTLHTCSVCKHSYNDNYTNVLLSNKSILSAETIKLGETVTATARATGGTAPYQYNILYKQTAQTKWTTIQSYKANATVTFTPLNATTYDVCIKVKDSNNTEVKKYFTVKVINELKNNSAISKTEVTLGDTITVSGKATGGTGSYQYNILYKQTAQNKWTTVQSYKANATATFKPGKATNYDVCVKVKDSDGTEVKKFFTVTVKNAELKNTSALSAETIKLGESVTVNAKATGGTAPYQYNILYKQTAQTKWTTVQSYKANETVIIKPTSATTYDVCVKVKDSTGTEVKKYFTVNVTSNELKNMSTVSAETINLGESIAVNAKATGSTGFYTYAVYSKQEAQTKWTTIQDFKANNKVTVKPTKATTYDICVKVKDDKGTIDKKYFKVNVIDFVNTSEISPTEIKLGETVNVNCSATGSTGFYQYAVYYKKTADTKWTTKQSYSSNNTVTIKPTSTTTYDICVKVKDNQNNEAKKYFTVTVK